MPCHCQTHEPSLAKVLPDFGQSVELERVYKWKSIGLDQVLDQLLDQVLDQVLDQLLAQVLDQVLALDHVLT